MAKEVMAQAEAKAARLEMEEADHRLALQMAQEYEREENFDRVLREHQMPGAELHPRVPPGTRIVIGDNVPPGNPPPPPGGWFTEFMEWVFS